MNYYPHHIGDFNNATRHLSRVERSVYRDMIELYYDTEQPLTLDLAALCRKLLARASEEATAVEQVLNEFFTKTVQGWHHARCEEEIKAFHDSTAAKSAAGKASAAKREAERLERLKNLNECSTAVDQALDSVGSSVQLTSNQEPVTSNHIKTPLPPTAVSAKRGKQILLQAFLEDCDLKGERPLRGYAPLWEYAKETGIDADMIGLAWAEFKRQFLPGGVSQAKRQKDWRLTFRNYVEKGYLGLWCVDSNGKIALTTKGKLAKKIQDGRADD